MEINFKEIEQSTGRKFENIEQLYSYISYIIDFLAVNNKNYNKKQYNKIFELVNIRNAIKF